MSRTAVNGWRTDACQMSARRMLGGIPGGFGTYRSHGWSCYQCDEREASPRGSLYNKEGTADRIS
jgi:hypothetical protein